MNWQSGLPPGLKMLDNELTNSITFFNDRGHGLTWARHLQRIQYTKWADAYWILVLDRDLFGKPHVRIWKWQDNHYEQVLSEFPKNSEERWDEIVERLPAVLLEAML